MMILRVILIVMASLQCAVASDACLSPDAARTAIQQQNLIDFPQASRAARIRARGEIVSANLCRQDQRLVYVLAILTPEGRVARISVDAKSGKPD